MSSLYVNSDLTVAAGSPWIGLSGCRGRKLRAAEKEAIRARKSHLVVALVRGNVLMGYSRNCRLHGPPSRPIAR